MCFELQIYLYLCSRIQPQNRSIMKKVVRMFAVVTALLMAVPAWSQVQFGVKAGLNVTKVSLDKSTVIDANNRIGWFAGPMLDVSLPITGLGFDVAVLYNNKTIELETEGATESETLKYVDVPVNLKISLGLGKKASIFLTTGPQFSFNIGDDEIFEDISNAKRHFELKKSEFSWNVGGGVKALKHLQVAYNYNVAVGKTADVNLDASYFGGMAGDIVQKKLTNSTHQISVALMF